VFITRAAGRHRRLFRSRGGGFLQPPVPMLVDKLERDLGVPAGGTTADREYTLETVNCVGACALGPLVIVDSEYHGNMTSAKLDKVLQELGHKPAGADAEPEE